MSRQLEQGLEERTQKRNTNLIRAIEFELEGSIAHSGGILNGFSVKYYEEDVVLTLRATLPAGRRIAHIGSETLADVLIKATRLAYSDALKWKADKWIKD